jgi:hypothetical protein
MKGEELFNIWLAFEILGLEMNFDNFICVTCISYTWPVEILVEQVARIDDRKTVYVPIL